MGKKKTSEGKLAQLKELGLRQGYITHDQVNDFLDEDASLEEMDDLYALPLRGGGKAFPVIANEFDNDGMSISPDGRWIAYMSTETGQYQVYVVPFPPTGSRWQISSGEKGIWSITMWAEAKRRSTCSFRRKTADPPSSVL